MRGRKDRAVPSGTVAGTDGAAQGGVVHSPTVKPLGLPATRTE
jgi:hypothetical protein